MPTLGVGQVVGSAERDPSSPGSLLTSEAGGAGGGGVPKRTWVPQNRPHRNDMAMRWGRLLCVCEGGQVRACVRE